MSEKNSVFQLDATTMRMVGVGLWVYDTEVRKLWYSGFADNVQITNEPICIDIDSYIAIVAEDDKERFIDYLFSMHTINPDSNIRYRINRNGEEFYLHNRVISSTQKEGGGFVVRGYTKNITSQVLLEYELEEASRRAKYSEQFKSAFVANISHEFRTPINAITGFLPLIVQSGDKTEKEEYVAIVEENSTRLLRLVNSLILLSELQIGAYVFKYHSFNLSYLIDRLIVDYKPQCVSSVEVVNQTRSQNYTKEIVSDENAVSVIISNLLKNALKYTMSGTISLGYNVDTNGCVICFVSDTGVGISSVQQQKIFDNFYQDNSFSEGIGLGLPLCKLIIQELGGRIWVESEPKIGTTIYFTLPPQLPCSL